MGTEARSPQAAENAGVAKDTPSRSLKQAERIVWSIDAIMSNGAINDAVLRIALALDAARAEERHRILGETPETIETMAKAARFSLYDVSLPAARDIAAHMLAALRRKSEERTHE